MVFSFNKRWSRGQVEVGESIHTHTWCYFISVSEYISFYYLEGCISMKSNRHVYPELKAFYPWTHSVWLKVVSWYQVFIGMHPISSRCSQTQVSFPPRGVLVYSFILHLHTRLLQALICAPRWGQGNPCALLLVSPLIQAGSKTRPEPMRGWREAGRGEAAAAGGGRGGAYGVTECLGTCHFVSVLASTSGLLSLWPQAKYD